MTKLWIGLGLLIVIGALFAALSALRAKLLPEEKPLEEIPLPEKPELLRAVVHCTGGGAGFSKYNYQGVRDCLTVSQLPGGGPLSCDYGCLGMGTCGDVCPTHAIRLQNGVAVVDGERCTACGKCVEACPRHIISLEPFKPPKHIFIPCASCAKEEAVTEICTDGCIQCSLCIKACPREAISLEGGRVRIDDEKCDNCGLCVKKCPRHLIREEKVAEPIRIAPPEEPKKSRFTKEKRAKEPKKKKEPRQKEELRLSKLRPLRGQETEQKAQLPGRKEEREPAAPTVKQEPPSAVPDTSEVSPSAVKEEKSTPDRKAEMPEKEKPAEGTKTSAEAFKAFEQAVAAVDEVLGEKEEKEPVHTDQTEQTKVD